MNVVARFARARIFVSFPAVLMLAASAFIGTTGLVTALMYSQNQISEFREQASENDEQAQCRSRINGYVEGLSIAQDIALGSGLLDRLGPNDDSAFADSVRAYQEAVKQLQSAKDYREDAVDVCLRNPNFDPVTDIKAGGPP